MGNSLSKTFNNIFIWFFSSSGYDYVYAPQSQRMLQPIFAQNMQQYLWISLLCIFLPVRKFSAGSCCAVIGLLDCDLTENSTDFHSIWSHIVALLWCMGPTGRNAKWMTPKAAETCGFRWGTGRNAYSTHRFQSCQYHFYIRSKPKSSWLSTLVL